jgi:hypothetical protein
LLTDVSEVRDASIISLMMEEASTSETSVNNYLTETLYCLSYTGCSTGWLLDAVLFDKYLVSLSHTELLPGEYSMDDSHRMKQGLQESLL